MPEINRVRQYLAGVIAGVITLITADILGMALNLVIILPTVVAVIVWLQIEHQPQQWGAIKDD